MTSKQVRDNFVQNLAENAYLNMCSAEEMTIAIKALEKQIPKKPNFNEIWFSGIFNGYSETEYCCPECDCGLRKTDKYKDSYCPHCGQAIDWR